VLTKSRFKDADPCIKRAWLAENRRDLKTEKSSAVLWRIKKGNDFTEVVRSLFPDALLIDAIGSSALEPTQEALRDHPGRTLLEAAFEADGLFAQVDVLQPLGDGTYHVIEAKLAKNLREGKRIKAKYARDLGFQLVVLQRAGIQVSRASFASINPDLVKGATPLTAQDQVVFTDVTADLTPLLETLEAEAFLVQTAMTGAEPVIETNTFCDKCPYTDLCHEGIDMTRHLPTLPRITSNQVTGLRSDGCRVIPDIPETWFQGKQPGAIHAWKSLRSGEKFLDPHVIDILKSKPFPWFFVDFEAVSFEVPRYEGTKPYDVLPFQWSGHWLHQVDEEPTWEEHLHEEDTDPRELFGSKLLEQARKAGTIFTYSSYERQRVSNLGNEELIAHLAAKECDLLPLMRDYVYLPEFYGSFSIKYVLPALTTLDYKDLEIADGETAAAEYEQMLKQLGTPEAVRIAKNLREYCKRDTLAMVEVVRALLKFE